MLIVQSYNSEGSDFVKIIYNERSTDYNHDSNKANVEKNELGGCSTYSRIPTANGNTSVSCGCYINKNGAEIIKITRL